MISSVLWKSCDYQARVVVEHAAEGLGDEKHGAGQVNTLQELQVDVFKVSAPP
jgi:hypothetical protein